MNVFFDHNLSFRLAHALAALFDPAEHKIIALQDRFPRDISDIDYIKVLSSEGHWIVISGDRRITRNRAERHAFQNSNLTGFFMSKGLYKAPVLKQLERLCALWQPMLTVATATAPVALFELPMKSTKVAQLKL